jgi:hypothetical protein
MKLKSLILGVFFLVISSVAIGQQGAIMRAQSAPGVYENLVSDGSGHLQVGKTYTHASVSVLVTTTALVAADTTRGFIQVQNQDATNALWVKCDGTAATADGNSVKIIAGATWTPAVPPVSACNAIASVATIVAGVVTAH